MRLLFLNYETALGSAVHATPVFAALQQLHPDWEIHVACSGIPQFLFIHNPHIHTLHITKHPVRDTLLTALQLTKIGLVHQFDAVLLNTGNSRPRIAWNALFIKAKQTIGIEAKSYFVNTLLHTQKGNSVALNNLQVIKPLIPDLKEVFWANSFEVYFGKNQYENALNFRLKTIIHNKPLIGIVTQTSGGQPSSWRPEKFIEVAKHLIKATEGVLLFFGSSQERNAIDDIINQLGNNAISLAGKTSIEELPAFCAVCDVLVTLDTGIMHIGRAVGVPMVVIAPAWQPEYEWLPLNQEKYHVIRKWEIGCRNCLKFFCETHECMEEISVEEVVEATLFQLGRFVNAKQDDWKVRLEKWLSLKQPKIQYLA
ncbi:MAG: glycosyltransferase family 9 protein [Spirosomataceae bacterium]